MYFTTHTVAGAALATALTGSPLGGFLVGAASHALLDAVPHHDYDSVAPGVVDVLAGGGLLAYLWSVGLPLAGLLGGLGAGLMDLEVLLNYFGLWPLPLLYPSHSGLTPHRQASPPVGILTQLGTFLGALALLWALRPTWGG